MNEQMPATVALPLSPKKKRYVTLSCMMLILFLASSNAAIGVVQTPILEKMDALEKFGIITALGKMGICIMTPIGGKLGDIFGKKRVIVVSSIICIISMMGISFSPTFVIFAIFRVFISLAQGAYTSLPYILINLINEKKAVPRYSGILASCMAFGSFSGSFFAGMMVDHEREILAVNFSSVYLLFAIVFIVIGIEQDQLQSETKIDMKGIFSLSLFITLFVFTTNYGPTLGWMNKWIVTGIVATICASILLYYVEKKVENQKGAAIIPFSLLKNHTYAILLIIAITSNFYQAIVTNYGPMISQKLLGTTSTVAGSLSLPRTIITLVLPVVTGLWLGKNKKHFWKAISLANALIVLAFLPLVSISEHTPVWMLITAFAITGIAESFRSISLTPAAQTMLTPETLSSGTALMSFCGSFATVLATTISGSLLGATKGNLALGIRSIFTVIVIISLIGLALAVMYIRPRLFSKKVEEKVEQE